jgi:two-component system, OmpR family, phosphate regulon sensor histidine kinase PhoR
VSRYRKLHKLLGWRPTAFEIAGIYAVLGALWILLSDSLLEMLVTDPAMLTRLQTVKGWFYVLITALLLYALIRRSTAMLLRSEESLHHRTHELQVLQEETKQERNRLQVLVDTAPVGIVLHSAPGGRGVLLFNEAAESILGQPLAPELDLSAYPSHYGIYRPTGEPFPAGELPSICALRGESCTGIEMLIRQPSGRQVYALANSAPIWASKGEVGGAVVAFQDITRLREQEQLRDEFLSTAAHELKTPVATIKGYVQMMDRWAPGGHEPREGRAIQAIDVACDRISRRVQEMLEAVRSQVAPPVLNRVAFDLGELASEVVEQARDGAQPHPLHLERLTPAPVEADRERIEEVLASLVENAAKYSPVECEIKVRVWAHNGDALVSVEDQGVGVPEERRQYLFEPFYQAVPPGAPGYRSAVPLGLYLSRLTIERHDGRIWLESEEGEGSTFYISLPLARDGQDGGEHT